MSQANVEIVRQAVAAINSRDIDGYLAVCTEDVELITPFAPVGGVYEGTAAIRRFFADIEDTAPDFHIDLGEVEAIGEDRVLASLEVTSSGRTTGIPNDVAPTNIYDLADGKIRRIRIFLDREEALKAAGLSD
jgi:ketosteroid isomerase-like protein